MRGEPGPLDPDRSPRCTCRYFQTDANRDYSEYPVRKATTGLPMKQPNPDCPVCPPAPDAAPIATKRFGKWQIDDADWWIGPITPYVPRDR